MPGVLDSDVGFSREVGKMAFNFEDFEDLDLGLSNFNADEFHQMMDGICASGDGIFQVKQEFPSDYSDSEADLLPDEQTVDLLKIMDQPDYVPTTLPPSMLLCEDECNHMKAGIKVSGNKDPFMGIASDNVAFSDPNISIGCPSMLGQIISPLEEPISDQKTSEIFSAWNQISNPDEYHFTKPSISGLPYQEDYTEDADASFPDTASTYSDNGIAGDDSDVDIETVTETPRSLSIYSSSSLDCSPLSTPSGSPSPIQNMHKGSLMTILSSSSIVPKVLSQSSTKSLLHGISSSASLEENLMVGRPCISGQKRKQLEKEKRSLHSRPLSPLSPQPCYSHILVNSNSVNFHDYAMSPSSDMSLETGRPTVLSKRVYRKRPYTSFDGSDKEKQHHHNQLERNRRQKLADLFTDLRDEIPKITLHSKASKVVILNEATDFITDLRRTDSHQESEISNLLQKQLNLKKQLRNLQSDR